MSSFAPKEFLAIGRLLDQASADQPIERRFRTAISRAYYAVFLQLREELRVACGKPELDFKHRDLIEQLLKHKHMLKVYRFADEMDRLENKRVVSDYKLGSSVTRSDEIFCLQSAQGLLARVPDVIGELALNGVRITDRHGFRHAVLSKQGPVVSP